MNLLESTRILTESLGKEDIKFLHLIDSMGYDNIINEIKNFDLIRSINNKITVEFNSLILEDNIDIISHLAHLDNPFIKEKAFKNFYKKSLYKDLPIATTENIIIKDLITGDSIISSGTYKNPFTDLMVSINPSDTGSYARIEIANRNFTDNNTVNIDINQKILEIDSKGRDFNLEFTLNHELAHITGVQLFNPSERFLKNINIIKENHSDVVSLIKIINDNNLDLDESLDLVNNLLSGRSVLRQISLELFIDETHISEHLTQPSLILLKDFLNSDFEYIKNLKENEYIHFGIVLAEEACNENYLKTISKAINIVPETEEGIYEFLLKIKNSKENTLLKRILEKAVEVSEYPSLESKIAEKFANNIYGKLDYELRILHLIEKKELLNLKFPFADTIINTVKNDLEFYREEVQSSNLELSEFFDYKEVVDKTKTFKLRDI